MQPMRCRGPAIRPSLDRLALASSHATAVMQDRTSLIQASQGVRVRCEDGDDPDDKKIPPLAQVTGMWKLPIRQWAQIGEIDRLRLRVSFSPERDVLRFFCSSGSPLPPGANLGTGPSYFDSPSVLQYYPCPSAEFQRE
jgi:hypothetical protein